MPIYQVYRGQHSIRHKIETHLPSVSFGSRSVAETYAHRPNRKGDKPVQPKVFHVELALCDPFVNQPGDAYLEVEDLLKVLPDIDMSKFDIPTCPGCDYPAYHVWKLLDDEAFVTELIARGFDGAIYGGSGANGGETEYRSFHHYNFTVIHTELV